MGNAFICHSLSYTCSIIISELVIFKIDPMQIGATSKFIIKVVNPTNSGSVLTFLTLQQYQEGAAVSIDIEYILI